MAEAILKVQKNKNVTLPTWLMQHFHVTVGDYIRIEETKEGVFLKPAKLIDPSQAYFWTKEWQEGEKEAEEGQEKMRRDERRRRRRLSIWPKML